MVTGTTILKDQFGNETPFVISDGTEIGYGTCSKDGTTLRLRSNSQFVGRSIVVKPVGQEGEKIRLSISATDTVSTGIDEVGPADCRSQVVKTAGLDVSNVAATIADGATVEVPLGDPHYQLRLKLKGDTQ
ncbi:hypothetical protein [Paraburkholderia sp. BL10I2N1]|uniref:hypothetical protein n=1 Tax=Paraburkholderia sp. BL10I2N1 TaxID=1938796 RepID=UPI00105E3057|nr:hypothetical protein [Paraburkholderia sp. BL10I2N1]TDN59017.1 hypothetical protein B0G77_8202 [Paraburkholderia sp. BL10I2N1]